MDQKTSHYTANRVKQPFDVCQFDGCQVLSVDVSVTNDLIGHSPGPCAAQRSGQPNVKLSAVDRSQLIIFILEYSVRRFLM